MLQLLQAFLDIALWRKGPQDLPASWVLAMLSLLGYVALSAAQIPLFEIELGTGLAIVAIDVVMLSGWLWMLLAFLGRRERLPQTLTAFLGVGIVFAVLDIAVLALAPDATLMAGWWAFRILAAALIMGRILMHALERSLFTGMALAIAMFLSTRLVVQTLLGPAQ